MLTVSKALTLERGRAWRDAPPALSVEFEPAPLSYPVEIACLPGQDVFLTCGEELAAAVGGVGSGKSYALMRWAAMEMAYEAGTGTLGAIVANTYKQLSQATLPELWTFFDEIGFEYKVDYVYNEAPPRAWSDFRSAFKKKHEGVLSVRQRGRPPASMRGFPEVAATGATPVGGHNKPRRPPLHLPGLALPRAGGLFPALGFPSRLRRSPEELTRMSSPLAFDTHGSRLPFQIPGCRGWFAKVG